MKRFPRNNFPAGRFLSCRLVAWCISLFVFAVGARLQASDSPSDFILDLPFQTSQALPAWLGQPQTPSTTFATLNLPIKNPPPDASLLVTVYFHEKEGGFLRIVWQGTAAVQTLSDNFYEGIGMDNQRSLLIAPETLAGGGKLNFQCGDATLGIQRIKLEWLEAKADLISPQVHDVLVTPETGATQPAQNFNGQLSQPDPAAWKGRIVNMPVTDSPQRIEQGVEYSVQLDSIPNAGRIVLKEAGLPLSKHLAVWINQQYAGTITPSVPDLSDAGYLTEDADAYVGWRDGSFNVPSTLFKAGVNTVQFSSEDDVPSSTPPPASTSTAPTTPLAVKEVVLQLKYAQIPPPVAVPPPPTTETDPDATVPTGPITPPGSTSTSPATDSLLPGPAQMTLSPPPPPETINQ